MSDEKVTLCNVKITKMDKKGMYTATGKLKGIPINKGASSVIAIYEGKGETADAAEADLYQQFNDCKVIKIPVDSQMLLLGKKTRVTNFSATGAVGLPLYPQPRRKLTF